MSFNLLSEPIRKYIRDKRWEQLRPIQNAAIEHVLSTDNHYILAASTASGKTEAAFLPVLSAVNFYETGVQVLYISPLIALINDQFLRVEALCKHMEIKITKWHGEANKGLKDNLVNNPEGIVLITPESIEAMFVNKPYNIKLLFGNLKFVIIDEIHAFIGSDRGIQLKSLLYRLQQASSNTFRIIGLSATIGSFEEAKKFTGQADKTIVLLDKMKKNIEASFRFFAEEASGNTPLALLKDLYLETCNSKVLIFPNSRGKTEEIAVRLKKIATKVNGHTNYFSHHSSIHKEIREYVEFFAKSTRENFSIACTSTLELGIDIGHVDKVVQVDATHSIASLIQRVGRSGRRDGATSKLLLYATGQWSLLKAIACWLLFEEGYTEPPSICPKPYDLLLHQILSITKGHSGIQVATLVDEVKSNFAFDNIHTDEIKAIVNHLIKTDMLEQLQQEVIIGVEGEKVVNTKDFYAVFNTEDNFTVLNAGNIIGEMPFTNMVTEGENVLLAAKIWKIVYVDLKAKKIEVVIAHDGKRPLFHGGDGKVADRIWQKMLEVLYSDEAYTFLNEDCLDVLNEMRHYFTAFDISDTQCQRPLAMSYSKQTLFSFSGTLINQTLALLFDLQKLNVGYNAESSSFTIPSTNEISIDTLVELLEQRDAIDQYLYQKMEEGLTCSKWGIFLPMQYQLEVLYQRVYNIKETLAFLKQLQMVKNHIEMP
jgi:ATP-dependent Lhr-like helicase